MQHPSADIDDGHNDDRDEASTIVDDESRWLDEGGSNIQFRSAVRVPVGDGVEPPRPETVVRPPASDTSDEPDRD